MAPPRRRRTATAAALDLTAPTLSSPVDDANGTDAMLGGVTTNEGNGTLYWIVSTSAVAPTATQVEAGQTNTGAAASAYGSQPVTATGAQYVTGSGLAATTAYYAHFMHEDAAGNRSAVSSGDGFTTASPTTLGFLASRDEGTVGDFYVSPSGSDANPGTSVGSPKLTIAGARAAAVAAGGARHIKVRAGTYREYVDLSASPNITISCYAAEVVTISGQDLIASGSWSLASGATDESYLTASLVARGVVYKTTVPTANIASSTPRAAFLHEGSTPLVLAQARTANPVLPLHMMKEDQWLVSSVAGTSTLSTYTLPLSLQSAGYTATQVQNADILFHVSGNFNHRAQVSAYNAGTFAVTPNYSTRSFSRSGEAHRQDSFALVNLLPAMTQGTWGYRTSGSDTILYVWPNDAASIAAGSIGYTRRTRGIRLGNGCRVRGLRTFAHAAGGTDLGENSASAIYANGVSDIQIDSCLVEGVSNTALVQASFASEFGYGAVQINTCVDAVVSNVSVRKAWNTYGFNFMGNFDGTQTAMSSEARRGRRNKLKLCTAEDVELSPIYWHTQDQSVVLGFKAVANCATQAHANQIECYIQSARCAFVGMDMSGCYQGYSTIQGASAIAFLAPNMPVARYGYGRGYEDQSSTDWPAPSTFGVGTSDVIFLCSRVTPHPLELAGGPLAGARFGMGNTSNLPHTVKSGIFHQASVTGSGHTFDYNILTSGSSPAGTGNTAPGYAAVYTDAATGDFTYLPGAALRSATRRDHSALVNTIKGWFTNTGVGGLSGRLFTDAEFDIGADAQPIVWTSAPFGPTNGYDVNLGTAPYFWDLPVLSGTAEEGQTLTATTGTIVGSPTPTPAYQWQETSNGGLSWTDVSGATSASYVLPTGANGKQFRRKTTLTNSVTSIVGYSGWSGVVGAVSTDAAAPVQVANHTGGDTLVSGVYKVESSAFTPDTAKALFVVVFRKQGEVAENPASTITRVSLGASGRASGAGTALTLCVNETGWGEEIAVYALAPGFSSGSQTILVECNADGINYRVLAFEVTNGSGAIGANVIQTSNGGTGATIGPLSTLHAGSQVLYVVVKQNGLAANAVSVTGATALFNGQTTASATSGDSQCYVGHEAATTAGAYSAAWTTPSGVGGVYAHAAIEIRKT